MASESAIVPYIMCDMLITPYKVSVELGKSAAWQR
jgi:hypothetical protein